MINRIKVKNYKSILDLDMELGRVNVLIGANGCGKSNILESIALGGAASADKLDSEFFDNRGIRVTDSNLMFSAFSEEKRIIIEVSDNKTIYDFSIYYNQEKNPPCWSDAVNEHTSEVLEELDRNKEKVDINTIAKLMTDKEINITVSFNDKSVNISRIRSKDLSSFAIFSPEESVLRSFDKTTGIFPLGKNGDGLFRYLKELSNRDNGVEFWSTIIENLSILDWFENMIVPENKLSSDYSILIKDRFMDETIEYIDQRSTNEGFLFLLFYIILFVSSDTPSFFAIDNIEKSFNPKMCTLMTKKIVELARKYNKQVIITTHSPYILDGIDLSDEEQRLMVVRRSMDGYTKTDRIMYDPQRKMKLSEMWMKGMIGGLPDNF